MPPTYKLLLLLVLMAWETSAQTFTAQAQINAGASVAATSLTPSKTRVALVVYNMAEVMPAFPGGTPAFLKFLQAKLKYPEEALRLGISGKVYVSFVLDEEGRILDPKVVRGLGAGLDEEALRLVRIMPWWTPGRISDKPVRVAYTLPIIFRALE